MKPFYFLLTVFSLISAFAGSAYAQRDYLTDQEIEVVRDAQQIDDRVGVLVHAVDRRLAVLGAQPAVKEKASEWGPLPEGTRTQLLGDIKNLLQKAVDDIDNLADRPDALYIDETEDKKNVKGFKDLFPKAVHKLADGAVRFQPMLKAELDKATDEREKGLIGTSIDLCDQIVASVDKLPALMQKGKH